MLNSEQLQNIESSLKQSYEQLQQFYKSATEIDAATQANNQIIIGKFIKIFLNQSYQPLEFVSQFLVDADIIAIAATCRAAYRLIYSPLGYRLLRYLRPIVYVKQPVSYHEEGSKGLITDEEIPFFTKATVDHLCSDRNLDSADEDDKMAILLTMRTNILATKQKVSELNIMISEYESKCKHLNTRINYIGGQREEEYRKIGLVQEDIEKLRELLKATQGHQETLRDEQERLMMNRQEKMLMFNEEKTKLQRQKDLLIKKIKSQQKEKEEGLIYAKEVNRILARLNDITSKPASKSHGVQKKQRQKDKDQDQEGKDQEKQPESQLEPKQKQKQINNEQDKYHKKDSF